MSSTKVEIINYSERAFAVVGESTKVFKEDLKGFGGKYNPHLSCGAGWIFPVKALESVLSFLEKKGLKVLKKDLSDSSSSSEHETKDSKDSKDSKVSKAVKVIQPSKAKVITPKAAKESKDTKASKASNTLAKKVVLSDSESDSEEDQVKVKPVKKSNDTKVSKASKVSESDSSDDEKETPHVSYEEHTRVTRELESAKEKIKLLQENLSKLQIRFLDCEEAKNIAVQKYKTLKAKVKESKKNCESVATSTEFEEPGRVESHDEREQEKDKPTQQSRPIVCVAM